MASPCTATYHGFRTTPRAADAWWCLNRILQKDGSEASDASWTQGSCSNSVAASKGTHDGGDAGDATKFNGLKRVKFGRLIGMNIHLRRAIKNVWVEHVHWTLLFSSTVSGAAQAQNDVWVARFGNGLADGRKAIDFLPDSSRIKFVRKDTGTWMAKAATAGYSQPGAKKARWLVDREKGWTFESIGVVSIDGVEYLFNDNATFYPAADFVAWISDWVKQEQTFEVVTPTEGYAKMWSVTKPDTLREPGYVIKSIGRSTVGKVGVSTVNGTWYGASDLKGVASEVVNPEPPTPPVTPPTPAAKSYDLVHATQNAIALRLSPTNVKKVGDWKKGATFATRVPLMVGLLPADINTLSVQEIGSKAEAHVFDTALKAAKGGEWSDWLEGDYWDISQANIWNTRTHRRVDAGAFDVRPAGPGSSHDRWGWVELEHIETKIRHLEFAVHAIAGTGESYSKQREAQFVDGFTQAEKIRLNKGGIAALVSGDTNNAIGDPYDGPGRAALRKGWLDAELSPCPGVNVQWQSSNGLDANRAQNKRQIDRTFARGPIEFLERRVGVPLKSGRISLPAGIWPSDHWPVITRSRIYSPK